MSATGRHRLLLLAYPRAWRERYGDELDELIARTSPNGRAGPRVALDVLRAGLLERLGRMGLTGTQRPADERALARILLVLCSWSLFVVGGLVVQRWSEHWQTSVPVADRALPAHAYRALELTAALASVLVLVGLSLALPRFAALLRSPQGRTLWRPLLRALVASAVALGALGLLVVWAHALGERQRNGHDAGYEVAFVVCGLLVAAALAAWTAAAVRAARTISLSPRLLRAEAVVAALVAVAMAVMLVAAATWWSTGPGGARWLLPLLVLLVATGAGGAGALGAVRTPIGVGR